MADNATCTDRETDSLPDGSSDDENGEPDPRIQKELDILNSSSTEINRLETELDEARTKYRSIVSGTSGEMETVAKGRKTNIKRAREYYRLTTEAKLAQSEAIKAARQYQTATGIYNAAKETVALAENRLVEKATSTATQLSSAWQEMLNHAINKVTVAEKERAKSEQDHKRRSAKFAELEGRKQILEKKFSKSIKKARPYFELKAEMDIKLMQQKQNVLDLQAAIRCNKALYNESLRKLESISEEIHNSRKEKLWASIPRMPCVGADTISITSDLSELDIVSAMNNKDSESFEESELDVSDVDLVKFKFDTTDIDIDTGQASTSKHPDSELTNSKGANSASDNFEIISGCKTDKRETKNKGLNDVNNGIVNDNNHVKDADCKVMDQTNVDNVITGTAVTSPLEDTKDNSVDNSVDSIHVLSNAVCNVQNIPRPATSGAD